MITTSFEVLYYRGFLIEYEYLKHPVLKPVTYRFLPNKDDVQSLRLVL